MAKDSKDAKSTFPKAVVGRSDAAKAEADKVNGKIDEAFKKLAKKMRYHAEGQGEDRRDQEAGEARRAATAL